MTSFVWLGPIVGILLGYWMAGGQVVGVLGAFIGGWLGHQFDTLVQLSSSVYQFASPKSKTEDSVIQTAFFEAIFVALGRVAKCDGIVTDAEIQWTTAVMKRMGLSQEKKRAAIELFDMGKSNTDIADKLLALRQACGRRTMLLQMFMEILVQCALADGKMDQKEWAVLSHIAQSIRFRVTFLEKIVRSAQAYQDFRSGDTESSSPQCEVARAYELLAVNPEVTDVELKRAYRRLVSQHHPDKLMAKGMPAEMLEVAKEKTQAIRAAYEIIIDHRNS